MIAAVFVAHNLDRRERSLLEASFQANATYLGGSYKASFNLREFYEYASSVASVSVNIIATGGPGLQVLGPIIGQSVNAQDSASDVDAQDSGPGTIQLDEAESLNQAEEAYQDLANVRATIRKYVEKLTEDQVVATEFFSASYETLAPKLTYKVPDGQNFVLSEIFFAYTDYSARLAQLHALLRAPGILDEINPDDFEKYLEQFNNLNRKLEELRGYMYACLAFAPDRTSPEGAVDEDNVETRRLYEAAHGPTTGLIDGSEIPPPGTCLVPEPLYLAELPAVTPPDLFALLTVLHDGETVRLIVRHPALLEAQVGVLEEIQVGDQTESIFNVIVADDSPEEYTPPGQTEVSAFQVVLALPLVGLDRLGEFLATHRLKVLYGSPLQPSQVVMTLWEVAQENSFIQYVRSGLRPGGAPTP